MSRSRCWFGISLLCLATLGWTTAEPSRSSEPPRSGDAALSGQSQRPSDHQTFQPLRQPALPSSTVGIQGRTRLDAWVHQALHERQLELNADAPRDVLLRRIAYDLTGLPPSADLCRTVAQDTAPDWYERVVERLLATPAFAEHWGKHWLDAVGYADSNGYFSADTDRPLAWRYRDYVIESFQADKPFDQFVQEQLAGDELADFRPGEPATPRQIELLTATHFLRNGQDGTDDSVNEPEAHEIDRRATLEAVVQVTCSSLLGLTVHCARCHDHKFENISQHDYYRLQAVFFPAFNPQNWIIPKDRAVYAFLPGEPEEWQQRQAELSRQIADLRTEFRAWMQAHREPGEIVFEDHFDAPVPLQERYAATAPGDDAPGGSLQIDADGSDAVRIVNGQLQIAAGAEEGWISTRTSFDWSPDQPGDWIQVTFDLVADRLDGAPAERIGYVLAAHDFNDSGTVSGGNVLIDGNPRSGTTVYFDYPGPDNRVLGTIGQTGYQPGGNYGVRITNTGGEMLRLEHLVEGIPDGKSLELPAADLPEGGFAFLLCCQRSYVIDRLIIERSLQVVQSADEVARRRQEIQQRHQEFTAQLTLLEQQRAPEPGRKIAWVTDRSAELPVTPFLERGLYHLRGEAMSPAGLPLLTDAGHEYVVPTPPPGARTTGRRSAFAQWLLAPGRRPAALLARVHVNRVWRQYFGSGLIATTDNLGESGARPTHPELLEELASQFRDSGFSQKQLHRLIVLSSVYRQSSTPHAAGLQRDPQNRGYWRMPLRRLPAESLRDGMLAVSGELDHTLRGPYVATRQTPVGEVVVDESRPGAFRRSVYLQQRRSQSLSLLKVFDAPAIATVCSSRVSSSVPLQSLAQLNSEFATGRAVALADKILRDGGPSAASRVLRAFQETIQRDPTPEELQLAIDYLEADTGIDSAVSANSTADSSGHPATTNPGVPAPGSDVPARERLLEFCQMLLASNPFLYLE